MANYRKGIALFHDDNWYIKDSEQGQEALVKQDVLSSLSFALSDDLEVEYTRKPDKAQNQLVVNALQLAGETALLPESSKETPPQGFVNPYNFSPLSGLVPRGEPCSHEYFRGYTGQLTCSLTLKTPFFTPDSKDATRNAQDHEP